MSSPFPLFRNTCNYTHSNSTKTKHFDIAFSWQWRVCVVDCRSSFTVVVDCRSLIVLFCPFVVDAVPCYPVG